MNNQFYIISKSYFRYNYFILAKSIGIIFGAQILHGFFYGISTPILWTMIADVADFSEWKNNRRATAIIFSAMMVGLKAGLSIGSSLVSWILGKYEYVANSTSGQTATAINGTKMLISIFPAIPYRFCDKIPEACFNRAGRS